MKVEIILRVDKLPCEHEDKMSVAFKRGDGGISIRCRKCGIELSVPNDNVKYIVETRK